MKMKLFLMACLTICGIQLAKAQQSVAALHHEGAVTLYSGSQIQTAIDNAEAGDTIYLSEGIFNGFKVAKNIAIIGAGVTTNISGKVTIGASENLMLSNLYMLSGVTTLSSGNVAITNMKIIQCVFADELSLRRGTTIEVIQSYIKGLLNCDYSTLLVTVSNSKVNRVYQTNNSSLTLVNCNIETCEAGGEPNCQNCIIGTLNNAGVYKNCLYKNHKSSIPSVDGCYNDTNFTIDDDMNCSLTDDQLRTNGYLGTDGTIVGINGGDVPFTLASPILQVVEHDLQVDNVNKKLRVTLNLGNK